MRSAIALLALLVCGCSPAAPPPASAASTAVDTALLVQLQAEVMALRAELAARGRTLHLVDAETGEDIGRMVDEHTVWHDALATVVDVTPYGLFFPLAGCRGTPRLGSSRGGTLPYALAVDGRVVKLSPAAPMDVLSYRDGVACREEAIPGAAWPEFVDTSERLPAARLRRVDLR